MTKAMCYLCLAVDNKHTSECAVTREGAVPLGEERSWREGVKAAKIVQRLREREAVKPTK